MLEDVTEIILNLKKVALKLNSEEPQSLEFDIVGPKEVTAGDISTNSDVEILNPDLYICTVADGASFHARMTANKVVATFPQTKTRLRQMICQSAY